MSRIYFLGSGGSEILVLGIKNRLPYFSCGAGNQHRPSSGAKFNKIN